MADIEGSGVSSTPSHQHSSITDPASSKPKNSPSLLPSPFSDPALRTFAPSRETQLSEHAILTSIFSLPSPLSANASRRIGTAAIFPTLPAHRVHAAHPPNTHSRTSTGNATTPLGALPTRLRPVRGCPSTNKLAEDPTETNPPCHNNSPTGSPSRRLNGN